LFLVSIYNHVDRLEQDVSQGDESSSINDVNIDDLNVDCSFLTVQNKLKLLCLNCCGLNLRLNYPEFSELIVLALKSPAKDIYLYDLEKFLISKSMSLNAS
jgi:hypothetical protein